MREQFEPYTACDIYSRMMGELMIGIGVFFLFLFFGLALVQ